MTGSEWERLERQALRRERVRRYAANRCSRQRCLCFFFFFFSLGVALERHTLHAGLEVQVKAYQGL